MIYARFFEEDLYTNTYIILNDEKTLKNDDIIFPYYLEYDGGPVGKHYRILKFNYYDTFCLNQNYYYKSSDIIYCDVPCYNIWVVEKVNYRMKGEMMKEN